MELVDVGNLLQLEGSGNVVEVECGRQIKFVPMIANLRMRDDQLSDAI